MSVHMMRMGYFAVLIFAAVLWFLAWRSSNEKPTEDSVGVWDPDPARRAINLANAMAVWKAKRWL